MEFFGGALLYEGRSKYGRENKRIHAAACSRTIAHFLEFHCVFILAKYHLNCRKSFGFKIPATKGEISSTKGELVIYRFIFEASPYQKLRSQL